MVKGSNGLSIIAPGLRRIFSTNRAHGPDRAYCAVDFLDWYRRRMAQMHTPRRNEATSFAEAAATSIRPDR